MCIQMYWLHPPGCSLASFTSLEAGKRKSFTSFYKWRDIVILAHDDKEHRQVTVNANTVCILCSSKTAPPFVTHPHSPSHTHIYTRMYTHTPTHPHIQCIHSHAYTYIPCTIYTSKNALPPHTHARTHVHTHTHTHTHTHIHTCIHLHTTNTYLNEQVSIRVATDAVPLLLATEGQQLHNEAEMTIQQGTLHRTLMGGQSTLLYSMCVCVCMCVFVCACVCMGWHRWVSVGE